MAERQGGELCRGTDLSSSLDFTCIILYPLTTCVLGLMTYCRPCGAKDDCHVGDDLTHPRLLNGVQRLWESALTTMPQYLHMRSYSALLGSLHNASTCSHGLPIETCFLQGVSRSNCLCFMIARSPKTSTTTPLLIFSWLESRQGKLKTVLAVPQPVLPSCLLPIAYLQPQEHH